MTFIIGLSLIQLLPLIYEVEKCKHSATVPSALLLLHLDFHSANYTFDALRNMWGR